MAFTVQSGVTSIANSSQSDPGPDIHSTGVALDGALSPPVETSPNVIVFDCNQSGSTITATSGTIESGSRDDRTYRLILNSGTMAGGLTENNFYHVRYVSGTTFQLFDQTEDNGTSGKTAKSLTAQTGQAQLEEVGYSWSQNSSNAFNASQVHGRNMCLNGRDFNANQDLSASYLAIESGFSDADGNDCIIMVFDSAGEWLMFRSSTTEVLAPQWYVYDIANATTLPSYLTKSSGTFNDTSVARVVIGMWPDNNASRVAGELQTTFYKLEKAVLTGSGTLADAMDALVAACPANFNPLAGVYAPIQPIEWGNGGTNTTTLNSGNTTLVFAALADGSTSFQYNYTKQAITFNCGSSDALALDGYTIRSDTAFDFDCTTATAPSSSSAVGTTLLNADLTLDADISLTDISCVNLPSVIDGGNTVSGGTWDNCEDLPIEVVDGQSATVRNATDGLLVDTAGTYDISSVTFSNNTNDIHVTASSGTVTLTLGEGQSEPSINNTGGATVAFSQDMTATFTNIQSGDTIRVEDNAGTEQVYTTSAGTTYQFTIDRADDTEVWKYQIDRAGYSPSTGTFTVSAGGSISIAANLRQYVRGAGAAMYTGTSSANVTVSFDLVTPQATIHIGDASVTPQVIFDEVEDALLTSNGMNWHDEQGSVCQFDSLPGVGDILFLGADWRIRRNLAGDVNAAVAGFVVSQDGTVVDGTNGGVAYVGGLDTTSLAAGVWDYATASAVTASSMGKLITDNIDAVLSTLATAANLATVDTNVDSILVDTGTTIPAQISALNNLSAAQVNAEVDTALADYDGPTRAELTSDINSVITEVNANEVKIDTVDTVVDAIKAKTDSLTFTTPGQVDATTVTNSDKTGYAINGTLTTLDALDAAQDSQHATTQASIGALNDISSADVAAQLTAYDAPTKTEMDAAFTEIKGAGWSTETLKDIRDNAGADASTIADAVLDEALSGHTTAGTLGKAIADIEADTNELQADWADGGRLDLILDARASQSSVDTVDSNVDAILIDTGATIPAQISALNDFDPTSDQVIVATNNDKTGYSISGTITTLDTLDTAQDVQHAQTQSDIAALNDLSAAQVNAEVDAALSDYDSPTKAEMDAAFAALNDPTVAQIADGVWDEAYAGHTTAGTFGKLMDNLRKANLAIDGSISDLSPSTTEFDTDLTDATGTHDHQLILFTTGTLTGYSRPILTYTDSGSGTITLEEALPSSPGNGDEFVILAQHVHPISEIQSGLATLANLQSYFDSIDAGYDITDSMRILLAYAGGKVSGGPSSPVFRNLADTKDVITGAADSNGNRTSASYNP